VRLYLRKEGESVFTKVGEVNPTSSGDELIGKAAFTFQCNKNIDTGQLYSPKGFQHEAKLEWGGTGTTRPRISSVTITIEEDSDIEVADG